MSSKAKWFNQVLELSARHEMEEQAFQRALAQVLEEHKRNVVRITNQEEELWAMSQGPGKVGRQGCDLRVRVGVTGVACGTGVAQGAEMEVLQATVSARTTPADVIFADYSSCRATRPDHAGRASTGAARHGPRPP